MTIEEKIKSLLPCTPFAIIYDPEKESGLLDEKVWGFIVRPLNEDDSIMPIKIFGDTIDEVIDGALAEKQKGTI